MFNVGTMAFFASNSSPTIFPVTAGTLNTYTSGSNVWYSFLSSSHFTVNNNPIKADIYVIGGGAPGQEGQGSGLGGGGASQYYEALNQTLNPGNYTVYVGAGGVWQSGVTPVGGDSTILYQNSNIHVSSGGTITGTQGGDGMGSTHNVATGGIGKSIPIPYNVGLNVGKLYSSNSTTWFGMGAGAIYTTYNDPYEGGWPATVTPRSCGAGFQGAGGIYTSGYNGDANSGSGGGAYAHSSGGSPQYGNSGQGGSGVVIIKVIG